MLTLYYKPTCTFSDRVMQMAEKFGVTLELKDISEDSVAAEELMEKGGKMQTPFLVDSEKDISMYETSDIIDHLRENYASAGGATAVVSRPRVHISSSVCESCEG